MPGLVFYNGLLLFRNSLLAFDADCCCGGPPPIQPICCEGFTIPEVLRCTVTGQTGDTCAGVLGDFAYLYYDEAFRFWSCPYPFNSTSFPCGIGCISRIILDCDPPANPATACDPGPQWLLTIEGMAGFTPTPCNVECDFVCDPLNLVFNLSWDSPAAPTFGCCMDNAHHSGTLQFTVNAA